MRRPAGPSSELRSRIQRGCCRNAEHDPQQLEKHLLRSGDGSQMSLPTWQGFGKATMYAIRAPGVRHAINAPRRAFRTCALAPAWLPPTPYRAFKNRRMSTTPGEATNAPSPPKLEPSVPVEEELVRGYRATDYYPVRLGDVFRERYGVAGKLGYGSASTVWLCRDLKRERDRDFVALKLYISRSKVHRERHIYEHINRLGGQHGGSHQVRELLDSFEIAGRHGKHICLVHEALDMSMHELKELLSDEPFEPHLIRQSMRNILRALDFLHREAQVVHTGVFNVEARFFSATADRI